jgi:CheY-specific phosphatase CheX
LASNPVGGSLRDWIAELANQLAGRIKNKLLAHGAEVYVNTPVVLRGEHLAPLPRQELLPLTFSTDGGNVFVWIELETNSDVSLGPPAVALAEGETLLF